MALDATSLSNRLLSIPSSPNECEELAYELLSALPRSRLASIQRRIAPLLQFDILSALPTELSLHILAFLPHPSILTCSLVCRRWKALTDDQTLWKAFCRARGWEWRASTSLSGTGCAGHGKTEEHGALEQWDDDDDEGMGDSDHEDHEHVEDSGFVSMTVPHGASTSASGEVHSSPSRSFRPPTHRAALIADQRTHLRTPTASNHHHHLPLGPSLLNYKLLFHTHLLLQNRFAHASYRLSLLQTRENPGRGHGNMIYCLQLYTYPSSSSFSGGKYAGRQVLFTGSRDQTVREWDVETRQVVRVIEGVHTSSVLSICAHKGFLASAGSDRKVVVWDLEDDKLVKVMADHEDSVLCVRFDDTRLVTCSKDRTVRTYSFPALVPQLVLREHRAAVNAVSMYHNFIVSGSGDRSVRLWDAETGKLLRTFDNHHTRGIASIDFKPPYILSGSSDKHLRLFDITTLQGWSTPAQGVGAAFRSRHHGGMMNMNNSVGLIPSGSMEMGTSGSPFLLDPKLFTPLFNFGIDDRSDNEEDIDAGCLSCPSCARRSGRGAALVCRECGSNDVHVRPTRTHNHPAKGTPTSPSGFSTRWFSSFGFGFGFGAGTSGAAEASIGNNRTSQRRTRHASPPVLEEHKDLVRSVALGEKFVVSGSYDRTIKVWDRRTGALVADLTGGHIGRIFCIAFDRTKVVSCGEDHRICIWDFAHGIDTSFIQLS